MQTFQLTCVGVRAETVDVNTYRFRADRAIDFEPGQFLTLSLEIDGSRLARCYSLSSLPGEDELALTIKRVPGGRVSNHLADYLDVGHVLVSLPPAGEFTASCRAGRPALYLSAGCGITPVYSMLRQQLNEDPEADIHFVHSARSSADKIFAAELERLAARHPGLHLHWFCDSDAGPGDHEGMLSAERLAALVPDLDQRCALMCGPAGYMDAMSAMLRALGLSADRIHREAFAVPAAPQAVAGTDIHRLRVGEREVEIGANQTVLEALEAGGLTVFAACRSGVCGSCKCKGEAGKIEHRSTSTLSEDDLAAGYFLACSSTVKEDMEVILP